MVYILDIDGNPLAPSKRHGKVRRMLNEGLAKVVNRCPFTIQLTYRPKTNYVPKIILGVDANREAIGLSANKIKRSLYREEVLAYEVIPRQDVVAVAKKSKRLKKARQNRRKYKRPHNKHKRKSTKTVNHTKNYVYYKSIVNAVKKVCSILPIDKINFEVAQVPITYEGSYENKRVRRMYKDDTFVGYEYSKLASRDIALLRDNHRCVVCGSKENVIVKYIPLMKSSELNYHNFITCCDKCVDKLTNYDKFKIINQNRLIRMKKIKRGIIKPKAFNKLQELIASGELKVRELARCYGSLTKTLRKRIGLPYNSVINARILGENYFSCISPYVYKVKLRKRHNRKLHDSTPRRGGVRKSKIEEFWKGFKLHDLVKYKGRSKKYKDKNFYIVKRKITEGKFVLGDAFGNITGPTVNPKYIQKVYSGSPNTIEIQNAIPQKTLEIW